jgi:Tat protein translocase TatC
MPGEGSKMTFLEHLEELRRRIIYCILAIFGGIVVCWAFREEIRGFLEAPLYEAWRSVEGLPPPQPLNFTSLVEPFMLYLKLSGIGGVFLAAPVILYNLWKFISPGLYKRERRVVLPFVFVSSLLFIGGSTIAYSTVFPIGIEFFLDFAAGRSQEDFAARAESTVPAPVDAIAVAVAPTPSDAGVGEGVDAGPPSAAPSRWRAEPFDTPPQKPRSLYDLAVEKILREGCGEFAAAAGEGGSVALRFSWHERTCGVPPELRALTRDGTALLAGWERVASAPEGFAVFEVSDAPPRAGRHEYSLHTLGAGGDGRKLAPVLMLSDYLSFALNLMLGFGILFELPVLIVFLSLAGLVTSRQLVRFSRWFVVIALVVGAILTPPDVFTQVMFAGPLVVLYFISVVIAFFIERRRNKD